MKTITDSILGFLEESYGKQIKEETETFVINQEINKTEGLNSDTKSKPYQTSDDGKFWDYSIVIKGIIYEVSINKKTGQLFINEDENQGD